MALDILKGIYDLCRRLAFTTAEDGVDIPPLLCSEIYGPAQLEQKMALLLVLCTSNYPSLNRLHDEGMMSFTSGCGTSEARGAQRKIF